MCKNSIVMHLSKISIYSILNIYTNMGCRPTEHRPHEQHRPALLIPTTIVQPIPAQQVLNEEEKRSIREIIIQINLFQEEQQV